MHPNPTFAWTDDAAMLAFVAATGWSRIFVATTTGPRVVHAPVIVDEQKQSLRFHLARRNHVHDALDGAIALALIEGPHGYISANWYPDPAREVPTWNYLAVECEGRVERLDSSHMLPLLDALSSHHESAVGENWSRDDSDPARIDAMLPAISVFELRIAALRGTRKLSQNKSPELPALADRVARSGQTDLASLMRTYLA
jgi:transcriptional regulator